ncbi:hypothetical protein E4U12_004012 [Claviceps purpurea]|nr:hypothetical protein E4U12_004012 [Claviceps purpurea]
MTERMVRARKSKLSMTISHDNEDEDEHKDELLDNATMIVIGEYAAIKVGRSAPLNDHVPWLGHP